MLAQNQLSTRKVSAAMGLPRGARTAAGHVSSLAVPSQVSLLGLSRTSLLGRRVPEPQTWKSHPAPRREAAEWVPLGPGPCRSGACTARCLSSSTVLCGMRAPIASGSGDLSNARWGAVHFCLKKCFWDGHKRDQWKFHSRKNKPNQKAFMQRQIPPLPDQNLILSFFYVHRFPLKISFRQPHWEWGTMWEGGFICLATKEVQTPISPPEEARRFNCWDQLENGMQSLFSCWVVEWGRNKRPDFVLELTKNPSEPPLKIIPGTVSFKPKFDFFFLSLYQTWLEHSMD